LLLALSFALWPCSARAHDPSAWGGLFRTRDGGATWLAINSGSFISGAIALAISPVEPNHLLLATDSGVLASRNGGRDWSVEAPDVLVGATFAVAYDLDGARALVSGPSTIFRRDAERWRVTSAPAGAAPARAIVRGSVPARVYLAGWKGVYRSDDWGASWVPINEGLPEEHADAMVVSPGPPEIVHVIAGGQLWGSLDEGRHWARRQAGPPTGRVEAVSLDASDPPRLWALVSRQLFRSDDGGAGWRAIGRPLPEADALVRGMAVVDQRIHLTTDRGLYRSSDGGAHWQMPSDGLPAHLEAGPIVRDPQIASTIYVGFAFTPYVELWRQAAEGKTMFARLDIGRLAGGAAFLLLVILGAVAALRRLASTYYRAPIYTPPGPPAAEAPGPRNAP
jgi:photosystem II stability/assembly factor-like uncharacterized protein